jgi:hypothetical protein
MENNKANEEISKFKLLSGYGGPGSLIHTEYGSTLVSCIEEWGFIQKIQEFIEQAGTLKKNEMEYVVEQATLASIKLSDDNRLLLELQQRKELNNLRYLVLMPDIELDDFFKIIKRREKIQLAVNSTFMPKGFFNQFNNYKVYSAWYRKWRAGGRDAADFFPPKDGDYVLKQDNIALVCENGHLSDFPWSEYLRYKVENPNAVRREVPLLGAPKCCHAPDIRIIDTSATASGFDTKWLSCKNEGCPSGSGTSLKGIMSLKIICAGHKPWEVATGNASGYFGDSTVRRQDPLSERCNSTHMRVVLTTANNIYYSRVLSSIFMPNELFMSDARLQIISLHSDLEAAKAQNAFERCIEISQQIKTLESEDTAASSDEMSEMARDLMYRFTEFHALTTKSDEQINVSDDLVVRNVTANLNQELLPFFNRILRIDNLKVTSAQLDFSRIDPVDSLADIVRARNIFRSKPDNVQVYPVVENFGEGILFSFDRSKLDQFTVDASRFRNLFNLPRSKFASIAVRLAEMKDWQLYLVHTFSHLIMRELEFRCGYPTASLSERLYVSNEPDTRMYGCMIYTSEGAEGSMGGLIAQTRQGNLNDLIHNALRRAEICNSDPLCWGSEGQGLFELNLASCFFCSLVSETSCEQRNIYLDRRILVDPDFGFFKDVL